jgi:hypothetical protein
MAMASIAVDDDSGGEFYLSTKVGQLVSLAIVLLVTVRCHGDGRRGEGEPCLFGELRKWCA